MGGAQTEIECAPPWRLPSVTGRTVSTRRRLVLHSLISPMDFVITARTSIPRETVTILVVLGVVFSATISACKHAASANGLRPSSRPTIVERRKGRGGTSDSSIRLYDEFLTTVRPDDLPRVELEVGEWPEDISDLSVADLSHVRQHTPSDGVDASF